MKVYTNEEIKKRIESNQKAQFIEEIAKERVANGDYYDLQQFIELEIEHLTDLLAEVKRGYPVLIKDGDKTECHFGRNSYRLKETYKQFIRNMEQQQIEHELEIEQRRKEWEAENEQVAEESND